MHQQTINNYPQHNGDGQTMPCSIEHVVFTANSTYYYLSISEISERDSSSGEEGQGEEESASSEVQEEGDGCKEEEAQDDLQAARSERC